MAKAYRYMVSQPQPEFNEWPVVNMPPLVETEQPLTPEDLDFDPYRDAVFERRLEDYFREKPTGADGMGAEDVGPPIAGNASELDARSSLFRALEQGSKQAIAGMTQTPVLPTFLRDKQNAPGIQARQIAAREKQADRALKERELEASLEVKARAEAIDTERFERTFGVRQMAAETGRSLMLQNMGLKEQALAEEAERRKKIDAFKMLSEEGRQELEREKFAFAKERDAAERALKERFGTEGLGIKTAEQKLKEQKAAEDAEFRAQEAERKAQKAVEDAEARAKEAASKAEKFKADLELAKAKEERQRVAQEEETRLKQEKHEFEKKVAEEKRIAEEEKRRAALTKTAPVSKGGRRTSKGSSSKESLAQQRVDIQRQKMEQGLKELELRDLDGNKHRARTRQEAIFGRNIVAGSWTMLDLMKPIKADIQRYGSANWPTDRKANLQSRLTNLLMIAKGPELYQLGVIAGPDMMLLERAVGDPSGIEAFISQGSQTLARLNAMEFTITTKTGNWIKSQDGALPPEPKLTTKQKQAVEWLKKNPQHPSAEKVRARLVSEGVGP